MNLLEAMQLEAPTSIELTGLVTGTLKVTFARASDLSRSIRFGDNAFGRDQIVTVRGVAVDVAGLCFNEQAGEWRRVGYDGFRRPGSYASDIPAKTCTAIVNAVLIQCSRLGEQFPEAFSPVGFSDNYSNAASARRAADELAADAVMFAAFADIAEAVDDGRYTARPLAPGDDVPDAIRWNKPRSRDFHISSVHRRQPSKIVGVVLDDKLLVGYVVDTREYEHGAPDVYAGPLLLPLDIAVGVNDRTTRW